MTLKLSLSFLALLLFTSTALSQTKKAANVNLTNTTWQLSFKESANDSWEQGEKLTFLLGGKLKVDGKSVPRSSWKLTGKKLIFSFSDDDAGLSCEGEVAINGNSANGGGQMGMRGTPFIMRLTKLK